MEHPPVLISNGNFVKTPLEIIILLPFSISNEEIYEYIKQGNPYGIEDKYKDTKVVISDEKFYYLTLNGVFDWATKNPYVFQCVDLIMTTTILHENIERSGNKIYTFGNIYGSNPVILDKMFDDFKKTDEFKIILGKKIANVVLSKRDGQFHLKQYVLRTEHGDDLRE